MNFFNFNFTIPASLNNPSNDQPPMQVNNLSTYGLLNIDHISFLQNNGGQHKQITFNQDATYVPIPPVSPPVLFTSLKDGAANTLPGGLPQLFYYSGDTNTTTEQYLCAINGSTYLFGGIILKWGTSALTSPSAVTFPNAFPNNCFGVQITNGSSLYTGSFVADAVMPSGFTAVRTSGSGFTQFYYVAIGN